MSLVQHSMYGLNFFPFLFKNSFCSPTQIVLSVLLATAFVYSLFRAYCYKTRQQRQFYDIDIFVQFVMFLSSNVGNALFAYATFISIYVLMVVRTQSIVKILLPINEQDLIEIFIYVAVSLKVKIRVVELKFKKKSFLLRQ